MTPRRDRDDRADYFDQPIDGIRDEQGNPIITPEEWQRQQDDVAVTPGHDDEGEPGE